MSELPRPDRKDLLHEQPKAPRTYVVEGIAFGFVFGVIVTGAIVTIAVNW